MLVCTAHISPKESIALADCAKSYGITEVVFSHPESRSVAATKEEIRDMLALGASYEFCVNGFLPGSQRISPRTLIEIVAQAGSDHAIITTDAFHEWEPPGAEMLRLLVATLLAAGMSQDDLRKMVNHNPRRLLKLN
jgi:predicted metal-dependent phosphotriesterase family hydrolase